MVGVKMEVLIGSLAFDFLGMNEEKKSQVEGLSKI